MSYITVGEVIFILFIICLCAAIIFTAGLWRAIELQNTFQDLALKVGIIQGALDVIQTVNLAQVNLSFDSLRSALYDKDYVPNLFAPYTVQDWAMCTSYPFPTGSTPPSKNTFDQKLRCEGLYIKTAEDLALN